MLRYFYILICTRLCFCYDYIDENQKFRRRNENSDTGNAKQENSRQVQFDVASFIKNSVTKESQDYEPFDYGNKNRDDSTQSDYYYESLFNGNVKKRDEKVNYVNSDTDDLKDNPTKETEDTQAFQNIANNEDIYDQKRMSKIKSNQNEIDRNLIHKPEKKCAFNNMKVPFFSRKPSTGKKQKRKPICTNCARPYTNSISESDAKSKIQQISRKIKRAYGNLCPKCIRKLLKRRELEKPDKKAQIHGSREFYQSVVTAKGYNDKQTNNGNFEETSYDRVKRGETEERERQLQELAEVEKKVANVKVTTPKFNIVPFSL